MIPGAVSTKFQPIVEQRGSERTLYAWECLTRGPRGTNFESADVLFEYARRKGAEAEMDRVCAAAALTNGATVLATDRFSINVHASTLGRDVQFVSDLAELVARHGIAPQQVIIEIIEHAPALNHRHFFEALESLRQNGFSIALDDVGLGHSNFRMIVDCAPDYLKVDRYFVGSVLADPRRAAVIDSVVALASRLEGRVIAEGVEDEESHEFLVNCGIDLFQGYYYAPPLARAEALEFIHQHTRKEHSCPPRSEFSSSTTPTPS
jgi:EAL domain-containing protein (putative c-di-GMP-specific phosphodiesterase class I)